MGASLLRTSQLALANAAGAAWSGPELCVSLTWRRLQDKHGLGLCLRLVPAPPTLSATNLNMTVGDKLQAPPTTQICPSNQTQAYFLKERHSVHRWLGHSSRSIARSPLASVPRPKDGDGVLHHYSGPCCRHVIIFGIAQRCQEMMLGNLDWAPAPDQTTRTTSGHPGELTASGA